jgi:molybdopterin-containing oxidoreductase family membrane subunit
VISVHSVVSWDFAVSVVPGWHSTLFPPYFVAGAILSGVAMVLTLLVPLRRALGIEELVTQKHLDLLSRLVLLTSLIVTFSYALEFVLALWRGPPVELDTLLFRAFGSYAPLFWTMVSCNCLLPLLLFSARVRGSPVSLFFLGILVNVGMWLERFNIVVTSLSHNRIPFDWTTYRPSLVEIGITVGSFGWFFTWFLVFLKLLPAVSIAELKEEVGHAPELALAEAVHAP